MSQPTPKTALKVVMGAMTFGEKGKEGARVHDLNEVSAILDVFQKHGHSEIDTAIMYAGGTSEKYLGELNWQARGLIIETKLYPALGMTHTRESIRENFAKQLASLKADKVEMFYLHGPDRNTPWEVTFKATDELYREGKFKQLGISNYMSWEVAEIVTLCRANGWVQPTVYQGLYNAIHRAVEPELFPCLRKFGLSFYEFNPLGGGFFTGRYKGLDSVPDEGSRFDVSRGSYQASGYRARYWNEKYFEALRVIEDAAKKEGLTMVEIALRWMNHHSILKREQGDAIIIGASSIKHIEENLLDLEKGPLPASVVEAVDAAWDVVKGDVKKYWH